MAHGLPMSGNGSCLFIMYFKFIPLGWVPLQVLKGDSSFPLSSHHAICYRMLFPLKLLSHSKACWCPCYGTSLSPNKAYLKGDWSMIITVFKKHIPHYQSRKPREVLTQRDQMSKTPHGLMVVIPKSAAEKSYCNTAPYWVTRFELPGGQACCWCQCSWECWHCSPSTHQFRGKCLESGQCGRVQLSLLEAC